MLTLSAAWPSWLDDVLLNVKNSRSLEGTVSTEIAACVWRCFNSGWAAKFIVLQNGPALKPTIEFPFERTIRGIGGFLVQKFKKRAKSSSNDPRLLRPVGTRNSSLLKVPAGKSGAKQTETTTCKFMERSKKSWSEWGSNPRLRGD